MAHGLAIAGAVLIGAGILVILRQVLSSGPNPALAGNDLGQWLVGAEFPGLIMIVAGAILLGGAVIPRS
jgi:hypothetical protein